MQLRYRLNRDGGDLVDIDDCVTAEYFGAARGLHRDHATHIEDQCDTAITHDGGTRNADDLAIIGFQALDHNLVLTEQLVNEQRRATSIGFENEQNPLVQIGMARGDAEHFV